MPIQRKELEPALGYISAAMDVIRDLPAQNYEREQFRNKVYHLLYEAEVLIIEDSWVPPETAPKQPSKKGDEGFPLLEQWNKELEADLAKLMK